MLVEVFLSDLIVIWRAWVLCQDRQWVILAPFILWIGAVGELTFSGELFPFAESVHPRDLGRRPNMDINS